MAWPFAPHAVRLAFLTALANVADGAALRDEPAPVRNAVYAALADAQRRLCVFSGRFAQPRALGSVFACYVTLFLGCAFGGREQRRIPTSGTVICAGLAVSRDGATLYLTDGFAHAIRSFAVADGAPLAVAGSYGRRALQFRGPRQLCVAPDGDVLVADAHNDRVQALTHRLEFRSFVAPGMFRFPCGVGATETIIAVASAWGHVTVVTRYDGTMLRRFPVVPCHSFARYQNLAVTSTHIFVSSCGTYTQDGVFVSSRDAKLESLTCAAFDEIVIVNEERRRLELCTGAGVHVDLKLQVSRPSHVCVHGTTLFVHSDADSCVAVFS